LSKRVEINKIYFYEKKTFYQDYLSKFESNLLSIESNSIDRLKFYEQAHQTCLEALVEIKEWIIQNEFENKEEEIYFFKSFKPQIFSKLIYYYRLFNLESKRIKGVKEINLEIFELERLKIKSFFEVNFDFYQYFKSGNDVFDLNYFVRGIRNIRFNLDENVFDSDERFSTMHDLTISKIMANEQLFSFISNEINVLENIHINRLNPNLKTQLEWTHSKIALIELIYSLHASKVFNNGNVDIKLITTVFEQSFNIDLGDIYRVYIDLKKRSNKTQFLDLLGDSLIQKIQDDDAK
jgi:predicted nucleic-acid-binding protein